MEFYVYAHFDEQNNCRYIGKGKANRAWSFDQRSKRWNTVFGEKKPTVKLLKEKLTEQEAFESEIHFISKSLKSGDQLINVTAGGSQYELWDERARSLLSEDRKGEKTWTYGIPRPAETRAKISATKRANPEESIARYWAGKKRDPELIKKLVAAAHTPEALKKSADKKRGKKHSEEHKLKIKESSEKKSIFCITTGEEFESINEAARVKGISCGRISEVVNGVRKSAKGLQFKFKDCQ